MAHGTPDWGLTAGSATVYQLTDLAELAVRLGSPISHDRRGDVIWFDDFEAGIAKWLKVEPGSGGVVDLSALRSRVGRYSMRILPEASGSMYTEAQHFHVLPVVGRVGFESSWSRADGGLSPSMRYEFYSGSQLLEFGLRYDDPAGALQYLDDTEAWVTFATIGALFEGAQLFQTAKFVVDLDAAAYVRAILNDVEYDLSAAAGFVQANATSQRIVTVLQAEDLTGSQTALYVDSVILTQNEPA